MILPHVPAGQRAVAFAVIAGLAAAAAVLFWLGAGALAEVTAAVSRRDPVVAFCPSDLLPLPLSLTFAALAVLPFTRRVDAPAKRRARAGGIPRSARVQAAVFGAAVAGVLGAAAAPAVGRLAVASAAAARGYDACPAPDAERRPPLRWARTGGRCP